MNALDLIALKQKVGAEYAETVEYFLLIRLDAAKLGKLGARDYNVVSRHLVKAQYIFARLKRANDLATVKAAGMAWIKAGARPTEFLDLTTGEYKAICAGLRVYLRALPRIERNTYLQAINVADQATR